MTMNEITPEDNFTKHVAPAISKLVKLCTKYNLPLHLAVKVEKSEHRGDKIVTESLFPSAKNDDVFTVLSKITRGELTIIGLEDDEFYLKANAEPLIITSQPNRPVPLPVPYNGQVH